jgi:phosphoglycolate phosphatase
MSVPAESLPTVEEQSPHPETGSGQNALESGVDTGVPDFDGVTDAAEAGETKEGEPKRHRYRAKPKFKFPVPVKAVLLDLDGTLLDTAPDIATAANRMRAAFGFQPLEAAVIRGFIGKGISNLVAKVLKDAVGEVGKSAIKVAVANFEKQYVACFAESSRPFPGVIDGLDALRDKGFRLGCVTNKVAQFSEPLLAATGLAAYFEIVVSGDTLPEKKPHPLPLRHAADFFGCKTEEMLMIGDSLNDAEAARAAGSPVFIVPYGYNEGQELKGLDCDAFIDDLPSALKYVKIAS